MRFYALLNEKSNRLSSKISFFTFARAKTIVEKKPVAPWISIILSRYAVFVYI